MSNENFAYQPMISTDAGTAANNVADMVKRQRQNETEATRIMSGLAINLADLVALNRSNKDGADAVQFSFEGCKSALRGICETLAPKDMTNDGEPDKATVNKMLSSANDAVKICIMLLTGEKTGFVAGYRHADNKNYVSATDYAAMDAKTRAMFSPEIFWNRAKTFPKIKEDGAELDSRSDKVMPKKEEMRNAYALHYGEGQLSADQCGLFVKQRQKDSETIDSHSDFTKVVAKVVAYLKTDASLATDDDQFEVFKMLASEAEKAVNAKIKADTETETLEQLAKAS